MSLASSQPRRVLLVDDDPIVLELVAMLLNAGDWHVERAAGGPQGLDRLKSAQPLPDVVLVDHQMPGANGTDIARYLHTLPAPLPRLIVMSASPLPPAERALFDAFIPKPVDQEALLRVVESDDTEAAIRPASAEEENRTLDDATIEKLRAIMPPQALRDLYQVYVADTRQRIAELERYATEGNDEALRRCAHSLKGTAAMVGVPGIASIAAGFEAGYLPRRTHERCFQQLRTACDDVEQRMILNESAGEAR